MNNQFISFRINLKNSFQFILVFNTGDPLHNILKKLVACANPPFIISCRAAEWRGATARLDIEEDYGHTPKLLSLVPLTAYEATEILSFEVGTRKAEESIDSLRSSGLETFFQNPLNLEFVAAILKKQHDLPETKADLIEYATKELCRETNQIKFNSVLAMLSEEKVLDAAGCLLASMLLAGKEGISQVHSTRDTIEMSEVSDLTNNENAIAVLASRLFRMDPSIGSEGSISLVPLHRTVAEFLGARWLANEIEKNGNPNRAARRLLSLISAEGGVPASLRGLYAWLPKFSPSLLGPKVIAQDPYGILRYGDGDHLSVAQASQIFQGLRQLASYDPYFRKDWEAALSTKGLARRELVDEIRDVIRNPDESPQLRSLLFDAIIETEVAANLIPDLKKILLDTTRDFFERTQAGIVLAQVENHTFDWPSELRRLSELSDDESNRLVIQLIPEIGTEKFNEEQIAKAVVTHVGILDEESGDNSFDSYESLGNLETSIPNQRIKALLIQLTRMVSNFRNSETRLEKDYDNRSRRLSKFARNLISTLMEYDSNSVQPEQLWSWIRNLWSKQKSHVDYPHAECVLIWKNDRLRLGIQRLALFAPGTEDKFELQQMYLENFCESFVISFEDAQVHLSELVERNNPAERRRWFALVGLLRSNEQNLIPEAVQKIARPYAEGDKSLVDYLTKKPKPLKLPDWEKKHRQIIRKKERRRKKELENTRNHYSSHIDEIRSGELQWILKPAKAYLGMFGDIKTDCEPRERISKWLGDDISQASLIGFEAVLNRPELPSAEQIVEAYSNSKVWHLAFPMLAAAAQRYLSGKNFEDLSTELVLSLAIIAEREISIFKTEFFGLTDMLNAQLQKNFQSYEIYLRQKFELMLASNMIQIPGLFCFVQNNIERPLSTQLSLEWLKKYPYLPLEIAKELIDCVIYAPKTERENAWCQLAEIVEKRLDELIAIRQSSQDENDFDKERVWRSVQFLVKFQTAIKHIPDITEENKDWLWSLTRIYYDRYHRHTILLTIEQLEWIVIKFRKFWPKVGRPDREIVGNNPWNATNILELSIDQIAKEPSDEAASALSELRDMPNDGYTNHILSAIAQNHRVQIEAKFKSPTISQITAVLTDGKPQSAADVQSIVLEKLSELQDRLRGDPLNPVNNFYSDEGIPRSENECRDQMLIALGDLPYQIQSPSEVRMPRDKRSDAAFVFGDIEVPLEAKGQWHRDVWTAATTQLDRYYCKTSKSASKGIYVVFWFGNDVPENKKLKAPPNGGQRPESPEDIRISLQALIPSERRADIEIVVLDVTR